MTLGLESQLIEVRFKNIKNGRMLPHQSAMYQMMPRFFTFMERGSSGAFQSGGNFSFGFEAERRLDHSLSG